MRRVLWVWLRRGLKFLLFAVVVVVTLLVLAGSVISYQGRREWDATKRELLAKGEKLSLVELAPPPIPDEMNFFADPIWEEIVVKPGKLENGVRHSGEPVVPLDKQQLGILKRLLPKEEVEALKKKYPQFADKLGLSSTPTEGTLSLWQKTKDHDEAWRHELADLTLAMLKPAEPLMDRTLELLRRPAARFPTDYEAGVFANQPHVGMLLTLGQVFLQRSRAELQLGQSGLARRDVLAILGLSHTVRADVFLISYLVRCSLVGMATKVVEEGVAAHRWSEEDLVVLERAFGDEDLLPGLVRSLRGERGGFNMLMEKMRSDGGGLAAMMITSDAGPQQPGWVFRAEAWTYLAIFGSSEQAYYNEVFQHQIDALKGWEGATTQSDEFEAQRAASGWFKYTHILTTLALPAVHSVFNRAALTQTHIVQARIACALERYYLAHLEYPQTLEALVPEDLSAVPVDIVNGEPMHFERAAAGAFRLWSIGVDGKDDKGVPAKRTELQRGDWVWGATP
ncbi:hypothetical protein BH09VER1_BH09VER1_51270 [soil metagenome]